MQLDAFRALVMNRQSILILLQGVLVDPPLNRNAVKVFTGNHLDIIDYLRVGLSQVLQDLQLSLIFNRIA
ncbi:hypothetical protein ES703_123670 [subsurface metagenome]